MIKEIIDKWEENKFILEKYFETTNQDDYGTYKAILLKIFELVIYEVETEYGGTDSFDTSKMTVIDDGDYQGTTIYITPKESYQPNSSDYIVTDNYYGSCSGCDTLLSISGYEDGLPSKEQISAYMNIALHLVQKMRWLDKDDSSCRLAPKYTPPFRVGKNQGKAILDANGLEVVIFKDSEIQAQKYCDYLNGH